MQYTANQLQGAADNRAQKHRTGFTVVALWILAMIFGATGCADDKILYSELAEIGGSGWTANDSLRFPFEVTDTSEIYQLELEVIHDPEFSWENAYVQILTAFPDDSLKTDVLSLELADGFGGWLGHCSGHQCHLKIPLQSRLRFPLPGQYVLTFVQYMRQEVVPGILGMRLSVGYVTK